MKLDAAKLDYQQLNEMVRTCGDELIVIENCIGQRFIGAARKHGTIEIHGTPGNALAAYLDGADVIVYGNAQDAVGDTANDGRIVVFGSVGDAAGYAMRGGALYVRGNAGYRAGVHMKEYGDKHPLIVIGGGAGSFLGEYLAGGTILVLNLEQQQMPLGAFTGTGMHGGRIFVRSAETTAETLCNTLSETLPEQVTASCASKDEIASVSEAIRIFCQLFSAPYHDIINSGFVLLTPNARNPYKKLYVFN
ncbi:MAG: glutamate synthase [Clostridiales bacterium]|nr:glutamate synthase [Clostridiales bacterium]MDD7310533.1 glutamate synthase [Eubacteriales bacterium]MDY5346740.1 glutamate synthase [Eubacteriales bacterium]